MHCITDTDNLGPVSFYLHGSFRSRHSCQPYLRSSGGSPSDSRAQPRYFRLCLSSDHHKMRACHSQAETSLSRRADLHSYASLPHSAPRMSVSSHRYKGQSGRLGTRNIVCSASTAQKGGGLRLIQHKEEAFWFYRFLSIVYDKIGKHLCYASLRISIKSIGRAINGV